MSISLKYLILGYSALVYWQEEYLGKNEIDDSDASPETKRKRAVSTLYFSLFLLFNLLIGC